MAGHSVVALELLLACVEAPAGALRGAPLGLLLLCLETVSPQVPFMPSAVDLTVSATLAPIVFGAVIDGLLLVLCTCRPPLNCVGHSCCRRCPDSLSRQGHDTTG